MKSLSLFLFLICTSFAQNLQDVLLDISNEVNQQSVSGATKTLESKKTVPAIARVLTAQDLKEFNNLYEVLETIPGITVDYGPWGRRYIQIRNIRNTVYNNKVLFVVNGFKHYEALSSHFKLDSIPIDSIKRLEIIKGPGSVLYGSSAISGVISIETFDGAGYDRDSARIELGSHGHRHLNLKRFQRMDDSHHFFTITSKGGNGKELSNQSNIEFFKNAPNGFIQAIPDRSFPVHGEDFRLNEDVFSFVGRSVFADLKLSYGFARVNYDSSYELIGNVPFWGGIFGAQTSHFDPGRIREYSTLEQKFLGLEWSHKVNDRTAFKVMGKYIRMVDELLTFDKAIFSPFSDAITSGFEFQLSHRSKSGVEFLLGFEQDYLDYEQRFMDGSNLQLASTILNQAMGLPVVNGIFPIVPHGTTHYGGVYLQSRIKINQKHELLIAGRQNNHETLGTLFTPKFGYTHVFNNRLTLKTIYGKAFRYPAPFELTLSAPMVNFFGNPNLRPESIQSTEFELTYQFEDSKKTLLRLTQYNNELKDFITVTATSYFNQGSAKSEGWEFELSQRLSDRNQYWIAFSDLSYKNQGSNLTVQSTVPYTWQTQWEHKINQRWSLKHQFKLTGKRPNNSNFPTRYKMSTHIHDFMVRYTRNKDRQFHLKIKNLFNEETHADLLTLSSPRLFPTIGTRKITLSYQVAF